MDRVGALIRRMVPKFALTKDGFDDGLPPRPILAAKGATFAPNVLRVAGKDLRLPLRSTYN